MTVVFLFILYNFIWALIVIAVAYAADTLQFSDARLKQSVAITIVVWFASAAAIVACGIFSALN